MSYSGRRNRKHGAKTINPALDRRLSCRYPAAIKPVLLSFEESGFRVEHAAELANVSLQGCLVTSRRNPRIEPGGRVWIKIPGEFTYPAIEGAVVSAVKPFLARCAIRIRFLEPLAYRTFKRLVYGEEGIDLNERERPLYENDQFWK